MKSKLMIKFNEATAGKYDFLKLSYIKLFRSTNSVEIALLYPQTNEDLINEDRNIISLAMEGIVKSKLKLKIRLIKSCFSLDIFLDHLGAFLEDYPSIAVSMDIEKVQAEMIDGVRTIIIPLPKSTLEYAKNVGFLQSIDRYFRFKYHEKLTFKLKEVKDERESCIEKYAKREESETPHLEREGGRYIRVDSKLKFIGQIVEGDAAYIADARVNDAAVHCGTVEELQVIAQRKKEPDEEDKYFYKFKLRDFTGEISCLFFPTKLYRSAITNLCDGKSIIASGKTTLDTYNSDGRLLFILQRISLCVLPVRFKENRLMRKVAEEYIAVHPKQYYKPVQSSLFDVEDKTVPTMLQNKRFCVFDLETTGLDPKLCEIMEIGALMIENGSIKETFSSFVAIENNVPDRITQLTGIKDADLVGQPSVRDVLADFMKFSNGVTLVGQNVAFDYSFISAYGAKNNIYFDNERIDTIVLARKYLKNMRNYTLKSIADRLKIVNKEAHRALSDAITTAEVLIKLAKLADEEKEED